MKENGFFSEYLNDKPETLTFFNINNMSMQQTLKLINCIVGNI